MKKKIRILLVWTLISLIVQFGIYAFLNNKVAKVMAPPDNGPVTASLKAVIPGSDLQNVQVSYDRGYLAYKENGIFKVFNLKKEKVVYEKKPVAGEKNLGVLNYQWLPDRDTLIYFYAKKNPNPVTVTTVTPSPKPVLKVEDPKSAKDEKDVVAEPRVEKHYNNPQLTELYTLDFSSADEDTPPDDRKNITIDSFPADGQIMQMSFSTTTNLMYMTVKHGSTMQLMEIDVMKNVRILSKPGELINNLVASDRYGTLYIDSKLGGVKQVVAVKGWQRNYISKNPNDYILGVRAGNIYLGEVKDDHLVKVLTTNDQAEPSTLPQFKAAWEGSSIPYKNSNMIIGAKGQVIVYNHQTAYIINDGRLKQVTLHGDENYISPDGAELVQLTKQGNSTLAELQPLE